MKITAANVNYNFFSLTLGKMFYCIFVKMLKYSFAHFCHVCNVIFVNISLKIYCEGNFQ